ncbi:HEPN domain-containing protein [Nocardia yamanashiensis]|uniref:HEPN domain-containing protein n=1 Tax=Nocardia yamanashiensis TaxID=209247 RepID=UPI001470B7BC
MEAVQGVVNPRTGAWAEFHSNWATIDHLIELRTDRPVSQAQRASLNKAAMVFIVTVWEAYVEDVVVEVAEYISGQVAAYKDLPRPLRARIASGLRREKPLWQPDEGAAAGSGDSGHAACRAAGDMMVSNSMGVNRPSRACRRRRW